MAIIIVQQPDTLSLSGNLKDLVVQTDSALQVTLSTGSDTVLDETYYPGNGNLVHLNFSDVINAYLAYSLPNTDIYLQTKLSAAFTVSLTNHTDNKTLSFSAIKGGKLHLNESASQFLKGNFLTWQPIQKQVTYYSPEWLTYYAPSACSIILKSYWEDGSTSTKTLVSPSAGNCYTVNLQYAVVSGMFDGKRPMYYDVWVESGGARLTYVQRYVASELQSDNEHWFLFENSLGGIDSVRAYGSQTDDPDYDYHMALRGNEGENYRIDVERVRSVNTGYLTPEETRWLQDLFATRKAYVYTATGLYPIVLTAGEGATEGDDEPSSFSFGYRFADVRPYLDIQRRTDLPENLTIPVPTGETFFLPPRLAEFPKQELSPDLLIPVEEPHTEAWGTLTAGMLYESVLNGLIAYLDGLTVQPYYQNLIKVGDTTSPTDLNVFSAARTLKEIESLAGSSKPSSLWLLDKSEEYFHLSEDGLNALLRKNFISFGDVVAYSNKDFTPTLPIASPSNYGLVKYDGTTLKVDDEGRLYVAGGGNSGIDFEVGAGLELTSDNYLNVLFGTTSNTACEGNDARLSDARRNPYSLSWSGYSSGSYDGASVAKIEIPNNTNQLTNGAGFISDANGFISKIYGTGHANQYLAGDGRFYTISYSELSGTPDLSVFVTLNTDQTITGLKTFEQNILSKQDIIAYSDSSKLPTLPIASASYYGLVKIDGVTLRYDDNGRLYVAVGGGSGGGISSVIPSGSGNAVTGLQYDSQSKTLTYQLDNSFLPLSGGTMSNTDLVGNLNADMLDGLHSNEFLIKGPRVYSKEDFDTKYRFASMYSTDYMSPVDGVYNYGQVLSFVDNCSTTQFYCPDNTGLIYFRNSWGTDSKGSENFANIPWYEIITSKNIGSQTVAAANRLSTTSYLWGQSFDGSGDVNGVMNFINQGNLITVGGEHWANNTVLSTGYDTTNGDWTKLGVAGTASNSASLILNYSGRVGIGVDYPTHRLHINGPIKAEYNPDYDLAHTIIGEVHFYNDLYSDPFTNNKAAIKVNGVIAQSGGNVLLCTTSGNVGIGTTNPIVPLHVMGKPIFRTNAHFGDSGAMLIQNDYAFTGWDRAINVWYPNINAGSNVPIHIGVADSEKNGGYIAYHYAGYNSDNNCMKIGLYAVDDILNVTANRHVGINTTTPQEALDVNGNIRAAGYARLTGDVFINSGTSSDNNNAAGKLFFGGSNSTDHGVYLSATKYDTYGRKRFGIFTTNAASETPNWIEAFSITPGGYVGIGTSLPVSELDVRGTFNLTGALNLNDDNQINGKVNGIAINYNCGKLVNTHIFNGTSSSIASFIGENRRMGLKTTTPEATLDVNGDSIFRNHVFVKKYHHIFMNPGEEGVYYTDDGLFWHNANNEYVRHLIKFDSSGNASFTGNISMNGADQINGTQAGIALNYECGKAVNTTIWDGQSNPIMRVFGEGRQVAIGAHSIDTPRGTLNVDGDVVFETSRFITTSGFTDGDYAYSHAIYGGYHGIDVCEFYENEFRFKTNGGDTTSFTLNRYYADFNGTVRSFNCDFTGVHWNGNTRFRLIRDGEYNTWLQAATDTTIDSGRLYMSGMNGSTLNQFNVWASTSNFKGSVIAEGDVTAYSDIRLKNRIETVSNVLDTINNLDVFRYTWKDREDKSIHIGVSAQQVQAVYPEFVLTSSSEGGTDYLTVNYAALATCIAIQGIKELAKKGDERDKKIVSLETEIKHLKERIKTLEAWS